MHDTLIIGAGAAGLAAASALRCERRDVLVLEASQRAGGRCHSVAHAESPVPFEYGAEFVHGAAEESVKLATRAGVPVADIGGDHWSAREGRITRMRGFWERAGRVMSRLPSDGDDLSFGDFLRTHPGGRSLARDRALAHAFVQGFHAADVDRISAHALAAAGDPSEDDSASRNARTVGGYTRVLAPLLEEVSDVVVFGARVRHVAWRRGHVRVSTDGAEYEARRVIVTLSPGVLKSGDVVIDPLPAYLARALQHIAMGSVARVTMLFSEPFWQEDERLERLSFLHTPHSPFNIWWTMYPLRVQAVVGWSGGPPAAALLRQGEVAARAVAEFAKQLGVSRRRVESRLVGTFHHDWDADPFARGAYSYALVGGSGASQRLARPAEGTLYLAGEATAGEHSGTVEGALRSGVRAAAHVMKSERA